MSRAVQTEVPKTEIKYDLHIHSALSPCADNDMTPATIVGMCALNGVGLIAVTDHNSAANLPYVKKACDAYGVSMIAGIEVNTQEEIHLLCYFPDIKTALGFSDMLYEHLPDIPVDTSIWGEQRIVNEEDEVVDTVNRLLSDAVDLNIYEVARLCRDAGGIPVPAHADKNSYSLLSVLGFSPDDLEYGVIELAKPHGYDELVEKGFLPSSLCILKSSDAHSLDVLCSHTANIFPDCDLQRFILK